MLHVFEMAAQEFRKATRVQVVVIVCQDSEGMSSYKKLQSKHTDKVTQ